MFYVNQTKNTTMKRVNVREWRHCLVKSVRRCADTWQNGYIYGYEKIMESFLQSTIIILSIYEIFYAH